jgi:4-hydroxy-tetrahydrodipicolinate synthase
MNPMKGIIPPMVTPLNENDELDYAGLEKLIEHLIAGGVHGLFILGTTGEGSSLTNSVQKELIEATCNQVKGRIPVLVSITNTSYRGSISIAEFARISGASALVLAPPFYYPISQSELYYYIDRLLKELPLPVFLYNTPSSTKVEFGLEMLKDLLPIPEIVGIKDSSGDLIYFQKLKELIDSLDLSLFIGPEELLNSALTIGAAGGVPGGANIFPALYVNLFNAITVGDFEQGLKLHKQVMQLSGIVYGGSTYGGSSIINGIKAALSCLGICNRYVSLPLKDATREKIKGIGEFISIQQMSDSGQRI